MDNVNKATLGRDEVVKLVRAGEIKIQEGALIVNLIDAGSLSTGELASRVTAHPPVSRRAHTTRIRSTLVGLMRQGYVQQLASARNSMWQMA